MATLQRLPNRSSDCSAQPSEGQDWQTYLGDSQTSKGDTGTGSRGLVHLTEHKGDLGLALEVDDTSLLHFVVQIVTLTSTLADTAEHGETTVSLSDVVLTAGISSAF